MLSPLIFYLYTNNYFSEALELRTGGIIVNGIGINKVRYDVDPILLARPKNGLKSHSLLTTVIDNSHLAYV